MLWSTDNNGIALNEKKDVKHEEKQAKDMLQSSLHF